MADVKISQLPAATTPVVGTEVLPIVQSGTTSQVSINSATGITRPFTANGVIYASSTSALATGSTFVFDGTNVGIGTSSPTSILNVKSASPIFRLETTGTVSSGGVAYNSIRDSTGSDVFINGFAGLANCYQFGTTFTNGFIRFLTGNQTEAVRIDNSGNLLVATTSAIGKLTVAAPNTGTGISIQNASGTASYNAALFYNNGATSLAGYIQVSGSLTVYSTTSDYRLKTVIGPVADAGQRIDALQPVEYTWNADGSRTRGFLAHQFQEVYAGSVTGSKDAVDAEGKPVYQAMQASTSEVIADLVAEIQSLRKRLTALEGKA